MTKWQWFLFFFTKNGVGDLNPFSLYRRNQIVSLKYKTLPVSDNELFLKMCHKRNRRTVTFNIKISLISCDFMDHKMVQLKVKKRPWLLKLMRSDLIKWFTLYYFFFSGLIKLQSLWFVLKIKSYIWYFKTC